MLQYMYTVRKLYCQIFEKKCGKVSVKKNKKK